ncbi:MAG: radical SAM family heme chaperone HemW [Peptoniphilaceae bacterium]|nr:radical SAM family heme chaperone HemW [Peptoniphilaceae bacterium]MDY6019363.1 radical SAM family heme chaperone HemW [Anaerococcus sp.]
MKKVGAYIHIPFCKKKCYYCDFCAFSNLEGWIDSYFKNLIKEIKLYQEKMCLELDSIYIGGGTPTYVDYHYIEEVVDILHNFKIDKDIEFTIEANPNSLSRDKLKVYKSLGINRISLGVQSFDDEILKKIGRDHTKDKVLEDIDLIRSAGFNNLSLDLILNLPGQNRKKIYKDLSYIKTISPEHLSWYSLIIEEGSRFYSLDKKGLLEKFDDDLERDIYQELISNLKDLGLKRYEISNFAKDGFQSYHNKKYRQTEGYIAFGLSAAGFLSNFRYNNVRNFVKYEKLLNKNLFPIETSEFIDLKEREKEYIIFKLRETSGINLKTFKKIFGHDILKTYKKEIDKFNKLGYFDIGENLRFTSKGMDLSNEFYIEII